jgi:hypothetical protein
MQDRNMGNILEGYDVDEEFIGRGRGSRKPSSGKSSGEARPLDEEALRAAVINYAAMAGGFSRLRETLESMDDRAFGTMARNAGITGVTRERALAVATELAAGGEAGTDEAAPTLSISLDRETFDDYIRRGMTEGDHGQDGDEGAGFSVGLDADRLSALPSEPPTDFSHDPKAIFSKIHRAGGKR